MQYINWQRVQWIIDRALEEDIGPGDATSSCVRANDQNVSAEIVSKDMGIIAGVAIAQKVFLTRNAQLNVELYFQDGDKVSTNDVIMRISGSGKSILEAERTALNMMGRLSGIATQTRRYVEKIAGTNATILDTRKTAPLLRELDKYAVRIGGAQNHRQGLYDMILIKENHIRFAGGMARAMHHVQKNAQSANKKIEMEVQNLAELEEALRYKIDRLMLDNFSLDDMRKAVQVTAGRVHLEASGGITLETVRAVAETGVTFISVGALTHTVKNFDVSLLFR